MNDNLQEENVHAKEAKESLARDPEQENEASQDEGDGEVRIRVPAPTMLSEQGQTLIEKTPTRNPFENQSKDSRPGDCPPLPDWKETAIGDWHGTDSLRKP